MSLEGCDLPQKYTFSGWSLDEWVWLELGLSLTKTLPVFTVHQSCKEEMQNWLEINFPSRLGGWDLINYS